MDVDAERHADILKITIRSNSKKTVEASITKLQKLYLDTMDKVQQKDIHLSNYPPMAPGKLRVVMTKTRDEAKKYKVFVSEETADNIIIMIGKDEIDLLTVKHTFEYAVGNLDVGSLRPSQAFQSMFTCATPTGIQLSFGWGNIADQDTDAIVNACNMYLQNGAGVTGAIFRAGGQIFADLCQQEMSKRHAPLSPGEVVETHATGKLRCKRYIFILFHSFHCILQI